MNPLLNELTIYILKKEKRKEGEKRLRREKMVSAAFHNLRPYLKIFEAVSLYAIFNIT